MRFKTVARQAYPSDLTDAPWSFLEPLLPPERTDGLYWWRRDFANLTNVSLGVMHYI